MIENQSFEPIFKLFDVYFDYTIQENRTLSAFWMSYVDIVEVMVGLVWAFREGVWVLHLAFIRAMIPWCFADDKLNYGFLPYYSYYAHMSRLAN